MRCSWICCVSPSEPSKENYQVVAKNQQRLAFITFVVTCILAALTVASAYTNFTNVGASAAQLQLGLNAFATQMFLTATCAAALLTIALLACRYKTQVKIEELHQKEEAAAAAAQAAGLNRAAAPQPPAPLPQSTAALADGVAPAEPTSPKRQTPAEEEPAAAAAPLQPAVPAAAAPLPPPRPLSPPQPAAPHSAPAAAVAPPPVPQVTKLNGIQRAALATAIQNKQVNEIHSALDGVKNSDLVVSETEETAFHRIARGYSGVLTTAAQDTEQNSEEALVLLILRALKRYAAADAINAPDREGITPLQAIIRDKKPLLQKAFIETGANPQGLSLLPVPHAPATPDKQRAAPVGVAVAAGAAPAAAS